MGGGGLEFTQILNKRGGGINGWRGKTDRVEFEQPS